MLKPESLDAGNLFKVSAILGVGAVYVVHEDARHPIPLIPAERLPASDPGDHRGSRSYRVRGQLRMYTM